MNDDQIQWLTEKEIEALFTNEESDSIERCESPKDKDKIAKAICAFSNNLANKEKPPVIFIGVKDNGECAGLSVTDEML